MNNASKVWFGESFSKLHPLLQKLHTNGGTLSGPVNIQYGRGISGVLGRRVAKKPGVPVATRDNTLHVDISHSDTQMFWNRTFNNSQKMRSAFVPNGHFPEGHWREDTGALSLQLQVAIIDGGWHWILKKTTIKGIPLPIWLAPKTEAYKTIVENSYLFSVTISAPLLGTLMSYSGRLAAD